jgi:energy-coupling factor transport system ATP-binding protein
MSKFKITDLHFSYTENEPILKGLNLELGGCTTAIVGQNGAGKTTFVKLLKGLLRPTKGKIELDGEDIAGKTVAQIAGKVGLVFQNPNDQIFKGRVIDELLFGPHNIGMDDKKAMVQAKKALEIVGLAGSEESNPYDMGLSDRKMVAIASILAMDTDVVIFDEPTIAQDYHGRETIKSIIRKLNSEGKLVLTIIHDMDFVADCFERTIVFAKGGILLDGKTSDVFSHREELKQAYLEPPHVTQLCNSLGFQQTFLTVEQFVDFMKAKQAPTRHT